VERVEGVDDIGIHRYGPNFTMNMTIEVSGEITVMEGDHIADQVEEKLIKQFAGSLVRVHIHYHPYQEKEMLAGGIDT
jgi:divalent metal cation (Fe/Co/Zn/Cd) transporter